MTQRIIDGLKIIEIKIQQGDSLAMTLCECNGLCQSIAQERTVWQTGKDIAFGLKGHF